MGAIYNSSYYDDKTITTTEPLTFARIGYDNIVTKQNITSSSSLAGFGVEALGNPFTYEVWKPANFPATLDVDAGEIVTVDYVAFGAHNLSNCVATVQYSQNGVDYIDVTTADFEKDKAAMLLFSPVSARYWRVTIDISVEESTLILDFINQRYTVYAAQGSSGDAYIGVMYLGKALEMQRGLYQGHTPGVFARQVEIRPNVSEGGQWLGRSVVRKGYKTSYSFNNLKAAWVREQMMPFFDAAITSPFFIAWRPETHADEVLFGWSDGPIVPANSGPRDYMSVSFSITAHGDE